MPNLFEEAASFTFIGFLFGLAVGYIFWGFAQMRANDDMLKVLREHEERERNS